MQSTRNQFFYSFDFQKLTSISKRKIARQKRQESYINPIQRAQEYQQIMQKEELTQSQLAAKIGVSRVRVNQYLTLLKLPQEKQAFILQYGKEKRITERDLRNSFSNKALSLKT